MSRQDKDRNKQYISKIVVSRRLGGIFELRDSRRTVVFCDEFEEAQEEREIYLWVLVVS
jgi:hypothetical protein